MTPGPSIPPAVAPELAAISRAAGALVGLLLCLILPRASAETIIDQRGRSVALMQPAERIVFIPMPGPATFISIDGSERRIAGMNAASAAAMRDGLLGNLFPGYAKIPTDILAGAPSSFLPNVESILALRPDVVFQWATSGNELISVLERAGLPVLGMQVGTQADFAGGAVMMGQVAGKEPRARMLLARQEMVRQQIEIAMRGIAPADRPGVLYLNRASDTYRIAGKGSFIDYSIALAGGRNVAHDAASGTVSFEQIMSWNPQIVLLGNFDVAMPALLYGDARWQTIDAVRNRRIYRMPLGGYRWDPPSHESALAWLWLAEVLQPARLSTDLRAALREWFDVLYGHTPSEAEIDRVLFAAENRASAGYDRFSAR